MAVKVLRLVVGFAFVIGLASCGSKPDAVTVTPVVMPDVVERTLDVALSDIKRAGFEDEVEVLGGGTNRRRVQLAGLRPVADGGQGRVSRSAADGRSLLRRGGT